MNFLKITTYPLIAMLCAMGDIPQTSVNILAILVLIDVITGVIKQYVIDPSKLSSRTGIIGIMSKFFIIFIPIIIGIVVKELGVDF
jgi:phage-related holin